MYDLVIRNGTVIDGSGSPGHVTDVAITAGSIAAMGEDISGPANREVDATGSRCRRNDALVLAADPVDDPVHLLILVWVIRADAKINMDRPTGCSRNRRKRARTSQVFFKISHFVTVNGVRSVNRSVIVQVVPGKDKTFWVQFIKMLFT